MHEALNKAGVANQLHTVPGGKHGGFSREERLKIFEVIHGFLKKHNLGKAAGTASGGE
jgi:dipeptidyl aminopeptidase/acylaminoacyl peptidase